MANRQNVVDDFSCAKCRHRAAFTRDMSLGKGALGELLAMKPQQRFRFVTCALCGYTEVYDLAVAAEGTEAVPVPQVAPEIAPEV